MQIWRQVGAWYLAVDGGTLGGNPVGGECWGPFVSRPELTDRQEDLVRGPSGEWIATVASVYQIGERCVRLREEYWVSPATGRRIKLAEVFA